MKKTIDVVFTNSKKSSILSMVNPNADNLFKNSRGEFIQKFNNRVYMNSKIDAVLQNKMFSPVSRNESDSAKAIRLKTMPTQISDSKNTLRYRKNSKTSTIDAESEFKKVKIASTFDGQSSQNVRSQFKGGH